MTTLTQPEPWLRGPVDGFEPLLMPVVHAFIQVSSTPVVASSTVASVSARVPRSRAASYLWGPCASRGAQTGGVRLPPPRSGDLMPGERPLRGAASYEAER